MANVDNLKETLIVQHHQFYEELHEDILYIILSDLKSNH